MSTAERLLSLLPQIGPLQQTKLARTVAWYFWRVVFGVLMLAGAYATYLRITSGLGGVTNLSDRFPWGIWVGFDVLCGVGLAAGGFTLVAAVHIFNLERYKPIVRPAVLTAFLGYILVVLALLFDLGRPWNIWHPLIMWNPRSVMFEVAWCVTLYSMVLALEFVPAVLERLRWKRTLASLRLISVPLVIGGVILSTLHQSSLGSLFLIVPRKLYPLWYSPMLPVMFFVSAVCAGLAMTIFESWHSSRSFGRQLEMPLLNGMARLLAVLMAVFLTIRFLDLLHRDALRLLLENRTETWLFALECALMAIPTVLLFSRRVRHNPTALYFMALLVLFGFIANRLNVSITGMEAASGMHYMPRWTEVAITLAICALGFAVFRWAVLNLPVFEPKEVEPSQS
ncbi:MAG: NrfD/PsrC family molybdoenzyme membrane anchor subunit [Bryobacteraceae bacterium]|jgi:Ni/Fe-hydrogenase subunit HybB-like protein